ncbi:hypothetical protein PVAND_000387 [Polypedilum vanderplanki]|uniref:Mitochondrial inner membrane protease ATP23 n=1 Tax=Polypedilum vanderplanki TaxID=319348 RepID=A0A9J6BK64_POLVA|nr:hypothetical protein PVAND_000387 [Polypedilum vanderplanki]
MTEKESPKPDFSKLSEENIKNYTRTEDKSEAKKWGYDLYPERRNEEFKSSWTNIFMGKEGTEATDRYKCEKNVYKCIKSSPLVKLMMDALKSSGCGIDIRRHISCEVCDYSVSGGYDPTLNQIVVCQNVAKNEGLVQGDASIFRIKQAHQNCVKTKALCSVLAVRKVTAEEGLAAIERVFPKCYKDLEPIGRRVRRNSTDSQRAYLEAGYYGYGAD